MLLLCNAVLFLFLLSFSIMPISLTLMEEKLEKFTIQMPGYTIQKKDEYVCYSMKLPNKKMFVKRFDPIADMKIVHHMSLYTCQEPFETGPRDCESICSGGKQRGIFVWARQALPLKLPADAAFELGNETQAHYVVLQIHYVKPMTEADYSGVTMYWNEKPSKYDVGVLFLANYDRYFIPPNQQHYSFNLSCQFTLNATLYPFAYRVHAHDLGRSVVAYHFSSKNQTKMVEVGRASPQWPQAFYPIKSKFVIESGDYLAARCIFDTSEKTTNTKFGFLHEDEMCYFYIMYAIDRREIEKKPFDSFYCFDNDFPDLFDQLPMNNSDYMPDQLPNNYFPSNFVPL